MHTIIFLVTVLNLQSHEIHTYQIDAADKTIVSVYGSKNIVCGASGTGSGVVSATCLMGSQSQYMTTAMAACGDNGDCMEGHMLVRANNESISVSIAVYIH